MASLALTVTHAPLSQNAYLQSAWSKSSANRPISTAAFRTRRGLLVFASAEHSHEPHHHAEHLRADAIDDGRAVGRRSLMAGAGSAVLAAVAVPFIMTSDVLAVEGVRSNFEDMPALRGKDYGKSRTKYPDYVETDSGLQYKDLREGTGPSPQPGERVVVDWDGFTIGYYGRIFEARNRTKGGSFEGNDKVFYRFQVGAGEVIPAFEEAIATMKVGGVRRLIVPPEIGYPNYDFNRTGPKPTTFSGQRALDFVLKNQGLIDKTLLFDIELMKIVPS